MDRLDILNRDAFVERLVRLVENIAEGKTSVSFAINGVWGCGKSFVLDMLNDKLSQNQSDKYLIVCYNCWEYDYYDEPLIAIVATILDAINRRTKFLNGERGEKIKGVLKAVGTTLLSIPNSALKTATGIDASRVFNVVKSGIDSGKTKYNNMNKYDMLFCFSQTLHSLQGILNEIGEQYTVVFLIDELDRCLPEYSIKVLERLHHLTENTQNIISIIAIDKEQLKVSVEHIFGFEKKDKEDKADKYLKKFIQFSVPLDLGITSEKIINKYSDYISLFDKTLIPVQDSIEECIQALFTNIDAREQEQLIQRAMLVHKLLYTDAKDYSFMCVELLIIILESCYQGKKIFTEWFHPFTLGKKTDVKAIPFSPFFSDKFDKASLHITSYLGGNVEECTLQETDSLYGAIAFTWYGLFLDNSITSFSIPNSATRNLLENNVEELKKFVNMIRSCLKNGIA